MSDTYTVDAADQLAAIAHSDGGVDTYVFDADGRRDRIEDNTSATVADWTWDAAGQLTGITGGGDSETLSYNPAGQLRSHQTNTATWYLWDPTGPIPQIINTTSGNLSFNTNHGTRAQRTDVAGESSTWVRHDHQGSHIASNAFADLPTSYDPYGNADTWDHPDTTPANQTQGSYRGELQHQDRIHLRNRDYDPSTGTFLSKDPLGVGAEPEGRPTSANLFAYVGNDPLNYQDPLGLCRMLDGDFYFEQNQDLCQSLADQFGTAACKLEGPGDLVAPYWDPVWDVNDTAGGGCEVPGFEHTVQTCEGIFGGWQWACDQEWAGYVFIDTEVCVWGCVGLTVGDGEVIFQGGCCGFQTPGFGAGVSSSPVGEWGPVSVGCSAALGHGGEAFGGETTSGDPYGAVGYSGGIGIACGGMGSVSANDILSLFGDPSGGGGGSSDPSPVVCPPYTIPPQAGGTANSGCAG